MSVISKALYKRANPSRPGCDAFTRKELKALKQHDLDQGKKVGMAGSYKRKITVPVVDCMIDHSRDLVIPVLGPARKNMYRD